MHDELSQKTADILKQMLESGSSESMAVGACLGTIASNGDEQATDEFLITCAEEIISAALGFIRAVKGEAGEMKHRLELQYNDSLCLVLPDQQEVFVELSMLDDDQLPELDIVLPADMAANCWLENMVPAKPWDDTPNVLTVRSVTIPIEPKPFKAPPVAEVKSAEEARSLAVDWQRWSSDQSHSPSLMELTEWQGYFAQLAEKFPELNDEFKENAIF